MEVAMLSKILLSLLLVPSVALYACPLGDCVAKCRNLQEQEKTNCRMDCVMQFGDEAEQLHEHE